MMSSIKKRKCGKRNVNNMRSLLETCIYKWKKKEHDLKNYRKKKKCVY
uniref:Leucine rich repeats and IQ motif containing 1 n=1 Tax=Molossus molossus TaxID=27622 RepID=A0A7J8FZ08_MOLMO|nr:leucine rich repeats and IQ motif containing 1 [Molossus molossus]